MSKLKNLNNKLCNTWIPINSKMYCYWDKNMVNMLSNQLGGLRSKNYKFLKILLELVWLLYVSTMGLLLIKVLSVLNDQWWRQWSNDPGMCTDCSDGSGSKNFHPGQVRSGQPFMVWVWIWKISPNNVKFFKFSIFSFRVKKNLFGSGQKVPGSKAGQPLSYCRSGPISSAETLA